MIPGPANILECPYCGGTKEVMSLVSGNTFGGTVWSDTRRRYPMLPEVSPIQKCPHCGRYYFIEQAKKKIAKDDDSDFRAFGELGTLNYHELKQAKEQLQQLTLTDMQRWIINHQLFMAYNDEFRRSPGALGKYPGKEDLETFDSTVRELLKGIGKTSDYELFHAELLRETGKFDEATEVLRGHTAEEDQWVVEAMLKHIDRKDKLPFLLIEEGKKVDS
ncbi:MAG: hypothetical protein K2H38_06670 [Muribaculaceae bacterium]|nr:hypothetical protein [Muribaculaceae bacterium]